MSKNLINTISHQMHRRGPDATGVFIYRIGDTIPRRHYNFEEDVDTNVFLMHKRLSILDLSPAGDQPMISDNRYVLIFNGEIYNHQSLRKKLIKEGVQFTSHCDTETLLQHLIRYRSDGLRQLEGMFSLAFFDIIERRMLLARDPFGIKPLFYFYKNGGLAFSSQLNTLLAIPQFGKRLLNFDNYYYYLRFGSSDYDETTLIKDVLHVLPGHYMELRLVENRISIESDKWFRWENKSQPTKVFKDQQQTLMEILQISVQEHLCSDVPVCFNLSGGIDSSALVAIASQHKDNIVAFTYEAEDPCICELQYAEAVARHCGLDLVKVRIDKADFGKDLDDIILDQGEPYGGCSIYAQRKLYEAQAKQGFKVCIDGQGGDELFAGYTEYLALWFYDALKNGNFIEACKFLKTLTIYNTKTSHIGVLAHLFDNLLKQYPRLRIIFRRSIGRDLCPFYSSRAAFREISKKLPEAPLCSLREALDNALLTSSIPHLVRYADRNAMSFSIENRVPFLCNSVAQYAHQLPNSSLISKHGITKFILRETVRELLPKDIINRKDKLGFPSTESLWLLANSKKITKIFNSEILHGLPGVQCNVLRSYWDNIISKGFLNFRSDIIWRVVNLLRWMELLDVHTRPF